VDTCVWSLALRRDGPGADPAVDELRRLIQEGRAALTGVIRQEVLSGIRHRSQFERLRDRLRSFPDVQATSVDYETAAAMFNQCRAAGIQGSNTDFLICALAYRHRISVLTTDRDFLHYRDVLGISLTEARSKID